MAIIDNPADILFRLWLRAEPTRARSPDQEHEWPEDVNYSPDREPLLDELSQRRALYQEGFYLRTWRCRGGRKPRVSRG